MSYNDRGGKPQFPQREKHILDDYKLRLTAEPVNGGKGRPTLSVTVVSNNPRLEVWTQVPNDKDNGKIQANLDAPAFYALLEALRLIIQGDAGYERLVLENKNYTFFGGKRSDEPKVVSKVVVGKDKEGVVYISVLATDNDRPKIKFPFGLSFFHHLGRPDGTPLSSAEISVIAARAWMKMIEGLLPVVMTTKYKEKEKDENRGGGGGNRSGGGGYGGGNRGGGRSDDSASTSSGDDDFDDLAM